MGTTFSMKLLKKGLENNTSHYFFGNTDKVTNKMISNLKIKFPKINISGYTCPPFLDLEKLTEDKYINDLKTKNPDIIWVSLGFPKQEQFINKLKSEVGLNSNFVGIGAVFEWVAGTKVKAPEIFANIGLSGFLDFCKSLRGYINVISLTIAYL